jgi:uncharacterized protein (TIGR03435 family)
MKTSATVRHIYLSLPIAILVSTPCVQAQQLPAHLTYDVAAIHRSKALDRNGFIKGLPQGRGYMAQNIPVKLMISLMYMVPMRQIQGGPDWLSEDRYDVEARADASYSLDDLHTMYQNLLADRFNLKFHLETREGPVYILSTDTTGSKMKPNDKPQDYNIPITYAADGSAIGRRVSMSYLSWWLGQHLQSDERPVIDRTSLTGYYDFNLNFAPVRPPGAEAPDTQLPSIFDALRQQLGLKLHAEKGPVEYLVIDHIGRPSEN